MLGVNRLKEVRAAGAVFEGGYLLQQAMASALASVGVGSPGVQPSV
jgi:hypothetical protein